MQYVYQLATLAKVLQYAHHLSATQSDFPVETIGPTFLVEIPQKTKMIERGHLRKIRQERIVMGKAVAVLVLAIMMAVAMLGMRAVEVQLAAVGLVAGAVEAVVQQAALTLLILRVSVVRPVGKSLLELQLNERAKCSYR